MRRLALCLLFGLLSAGCTKGRSADATRPPGSSASAPAPSSSAPAAMRSRRRDPGRLARVEPGMSEEQVTALLGKPDDEGRQPHVDGASAAWAYGADARDGFAFGGLVLFDASHKVLMTRSPIDSV